VALDVDKIGEDGAKENVREKVFLPKPLKSTTFIFFSGTISREKISQLRSLLSI
jgi:hypothetical protein